MASSSSTMNLWHIRSSSSVDTPGFTCSPIMSSTLAASLPATRILSCSSGVFIVTLIPRGDPVLLGLRGMERRTARLLLGGRTIVAATRLWYKARALEAINDTHAPKPVAGCPRLLRGCSRGRRGGLTRKKELPWPTYPYAGCLKRACILVTKPASGTQKWHRSFLAKEIASI